jgi:hypothetical protein
MARSASRGPLIALFLGLAACQSAAVDWTKPGGTADERARDRQQCRTEAESLTPHAFDQRMQGVMTDPQDTKQLESSCMMGRGWRLAPVGGP